MPLLTEIAILLMSKCPIGPRNPPASFLGDSADRPEQQRFTDQTTQADELIGVHCELEVMRMHKLTMFLICFLILIFGLGTSLALAANMAISLDGYGDYVSVPHNSIFNFSDKLSLEAWVYYCGTRHGDHDGIITKTNPNFTWGTGWALRRTMEFRIRTSDTPSTGRGHEPVGVELDINQWNHVAVIYDGSKVIIYKNGVSVYESTQTGYVHNNAYSVTIGSQAFYLRDLWGILDEVRIWNVARSPEEVLNNMNRPLSGNESGLVGYWKFDETSGTIAHDSSPDGNDGTLIGNAHFLQSSAPVEDNQPDLRPIDIAVSDSTPLVGETLTITATVKNFGDGDAVDASEVLISDGHPPVADPADVIKAISIGPIPAGGERTVEADWIWTLEPGNHDIYVSADSTDAIPESNEDNNLDFESIQILCTPDNVEEQHCPTSNRAIIIVPYYHQGYVAYTRSSICSDLESKLDDNGYLVNYKKDKQVTIPKLEKWLNDDYGIIHITSHGSVDDVAIEYFDSMDELWERWDELREHYGLASNAEMNRLFSNNRDEAENKPYIGIKGNFIRLYCDGLPQHPLVFFEACHMGSNEDMRDAFLCKGAGAYAGYDDRVIFASSPIVPYCIHLRRTVGKGTRDFYHHFLDSGLSVRDARENTDPVDADGREADLVSYGQDEYLFAPIITLGTCPIDLHITDPDGFTISKTLTEIPNAVYKEADINGDGDPDDTILIPVRKTGNYYITVIPEPGADPTDTYTLKVYGVSTTIVLAENVPIISIPTEPYRIQSSAGEIKLVVPATIDLDPDALNLVSKGKWVSCYIELSEDYGEYSVEQINASTVNLWVEETQIPAEEKPTALGDYDEDGIPDLMVKFDRRTLVEYLSTADDALADATLTVNGQMGEAIFEGMDTITIIGGDKATPIPEKLTAPAKPMKFALNQSYPNPFNPDTWIPYQVAEDVKVTIRIYNAAGRIVRTLDLGHRSAGFYVSKEKAAYWDGRNEAGERVSSGIYFYTIQAGEFTATRKMVISQ